MRSMRQISNAISWLLLMAIFINSLEMSNARGINIGWIDPTATDDAHANRVPANPWQRGCNPITRCRIGVPEGKTVLPEVDFLAPASF
ncbi:hypothetical protein ACOSQ3_021674 [Xanthoceras sorbifolium]